jgi:hypothetical protein
VGIQIIASGVTGTRFAARGQSKGDNL